MESIGMIAAVTWAGLLAGQDAKDPAELLQKLSEELRGAIKTAGKDLDVRQKLTKLAKSTFDKDLSAAAAKSPKGAWEYQSELLEHIALADTHFRDERDKAERAMWIAACKAAYARQLGGCKEAALAAQDAPAVDQVYYDLTQALARVAKRFARGADDFDKAGYDAAKQAFSALIPKAKAPQGDSKVLYTKWLVDVDKIYPLNTDDQKKQNTIPNTLLKGAAKTALDRAQAAPK